MPLTRHLYREDEVRAALLWCIMKRRITETAFWATELEESGCEFDAEIVKAWTYGIGAAGLGFLGKLDGTVRTAIALAFYPHRDASVIAVLGSKPTATGSPTIPDGDWTAEEACALRAMIQGRAGTAFAIEWPWSLWHTAMRFKHGRTFEIEECLEAKALAVSIVCQATLVVKEPSFEAPVEVASAIEAWPDLRLRERRVYAIPIECLSHLTARGRLDCYTSTEAEIRDLKRLERTLEKSPLWAEAIVLARTSDDEYEDFYDSYFDDIPDEWSLVDRAKSHGRGTNQCDLKRFLVRWFGSMSSVIWKGILNAELEGTGFSLKSLPKVGPLAPVKRSIHSVQ
jgi:hypothetical protein